MLDLSGHFFKKNKIRVEFAGIVYTVKKVKYKMDDKKTSSKPGFSILKATHMTARFYLVGDPSLR